MSKSKSTPQTFLDLFLKDVRKFLPRFDKGLDAYLLKCKGKPGPYGVSLHQYMKWLNPVARLPANASEVSIITSGYLHYFWQLSKPNFVFEPVLVNHLVESVLPDELPAEILQRLPYWSQWITLPLHLVSKDNILDLDFDGAFVGYTSIDNRPALVLAAPFVSNNQNMRSNNFTPFVTSHVFLDAPVRPEFLVRNSHVLNVDADAMSKEAYAVLIMNIHHFLVKVINCVMYICSQQQALYQEGHSQPKPQRLGKSYRITPPKDDRMITVGAEMTKILKDFEAEVEACTRAFNGRKPHIRKAHYHHFWTGPKVGVRSLVCKWLPPSIVRGTIVEQ